MSYNGYKKWKISVTVNVFSTFNNRIEHNNQQISNRNVLYLKKVDPKEEGLVVDMAQFETGEKTLMIL